MKLKLYKFRSLGDDAFTWTKSIIDTGEFWCSPIWEQNDSMEGVYSYWQTNEFLDRPIDIFAQKNSYRICSFSGKSAMKDPKMWGYYANGFKGLAVEIEVASDEVEKVDYQNSLFCEDANSYDIIKKIITTKLQRWKSENKYRFLTKGETGNRKIGQITGIYFGDPYSCIENANQIFANSPKLQKYIERREHLIELSKRHNYSCFSVGFVQENETWKVAYKRID